MELRSDFIKISLSNIFLIILLPERFHQNCQTAFGRCVGYPMDIFKNVNPVNLLNIHQGLYFSMIKKASIQTFLSLKKSGLFLCWSTTTIIKNNISALIKIYVQKVLKHVGLVIQIDKNTCNHINIQP